MKKNKRIITTLAFLIVAVIIFAGTAFYSYGKKRDECFQRLVGYTDQIAEQIQSEMDEDRDYLLQFSRQLSKYDLDDTELLCEELNLPSNLGLLSEMEILFPDGQLLRSDGSLVNAEGILSYEELKEKSDFISRRTSDIDDPEKQIIRHCVPIRQNRKVAAILCGVIDLADMPDFFRIYDYGDDYSVFVFEATTGMYIQDTWHDELLSIDSLGKRETKRGYDQETFDEAVRNQQAATLVFMSKTAGEYFYMYAAPVGVEDWMVMVSVLEPVVFEQATEMLTTFAVAAVVLLFVFAIYFLWILRDIHRDNREKEKQIRNVSYMLAVENMLFDAHIYPNHFTLALKHIAEYLEAETGFLWLTEDGWAVERRYWHYGNDVFQEDFKTFRTVYPEIYAELQRTHGIIINNKKELLDTFPNEGKQLAERRVHSLALIPVYDVKGKAVFVLGVCNLRHYCESLEPLQQVAVTFSMTINHYEAYHALQTMGTTDAMTGLLNRNRYHETIDAMETDKPERLGCIYIDINGLHEINNHLGHQAGDNLLRSVADVLRKCFTDALIYRIGGDEFVIFCENCTQEKMKAALANAREETGRLKYELSVGAEWAEGDYKINKVIENAEKKMREDKEFFYKNGGKERSLRQLNEQMERMISEKEDAEAFISLLEPEFRGVFFVNLDTDEVRQLFSTDYFEDILEEVGGSYTQAIVEYAHRYVVEEDVPKFLQTADFEWLKEQLDNETFEGFDYHKKDGALLSLRIAKFNADEENKYKTQWIFKSVH